MTTTSGKAKVGAVGILALSLIAGLVTFPPPTTAQTIQEYFYDVHGRVVATTTAPPNGGSLSRYALDAADNRSSKVVRVSPVRVAQDELRSGESLLPGQSIRSLDNRFTFILQTDGNAGVYGPSGALWASGTNGLNAITLDMQSDGNSGIRDAAFNAVWQTSTNGYPGAFYKMRNDGNLVILHGSTVIWQSGTCCH